MNIHIPQSMQTKCELLLIANAAKRFVSPATSKIAINAKQDTLMGSYVLTTDEAIDWKDAMNISMITSVGIHNSIPKNKFIPGKFLYSEIIPEGLNIIRRRDNKYIMRIINGMIEDGTFGKSEIAAIIQKSWFQYGSKKTMNFVDDLQRMILAYLMIKGFTIGIKDTVFPEKMHRSIYKIIETKRKEILGLITEFENDPYIMTSEAFEESMMTSLQAVLNDIQKLTMNNFDPRTGMFVTISSGSSGTEMNAGQIIGAIGQVVVEGKRIQKKFNNRTLPTFAQNDDSALARGFCRNSFISGLDPNEFFFQVMAGREGIINTAIKTADKPRNRWVISHTVSATGSRFQGWEILLERKNGVNFSR